MGVLYLYIRMCVIQGCYSSVGVQYIDRLVVMQADPWAFFSWALTCISSDRQAPPPDDKFRTEAVVQKRHVKPGETDGLQLLPSK